MPDAVKAMGITDAQFYGNLSFYWNQYQFPPYDLAGLTDAIDTSIVKPRMDGQAMIDAHPYLTRLNTYLSPSEMNQDAFFFESTNLPDVPLVHTATIDAVCGDMQFMQCNAPTRLELADGRTIWLSSGNHAMTCDYGRANYDLSGLTSLPAAQAAYKREVSGPGTAVVDNTAKIQATIDANNARMTLAMIFPTGAGGVDGASGAAGTTGAAGASGAAGATGAAGAGAAGGAAGTAATGAGGAPHLSGGNGTDAGCACDLRGGDAPTAFAASALGLAILLRSRRRASRGGTL